jgi:exosome complex component RRP42
MNDIIAEVKEGYIAQLAKSGKRVDERGYDQYREVKISRGVIETAEGSAKVELGKTVVIVGVKVGLGEPFADTPDRGVLTTNAELVPLASPTFEPGPPNDVSIEVARVVDRGIREGEAIDLYKLCLTPGEEVWVIFVDIHVLNYDGNLIDAAALGAISALHDTVVPASNYDKGEDFKLEVLNTVVSCTCAKVGDTILLDPSLDEERVAKGRITAGIDENGAIRAIQKGLVGSFTLDEVKRVLEISKRAAKELIKAVKES